MATLGNSTTPTAGYDAPGSGYAAATTYTMPAGGGIVTSISGYFDATASGHSGWLCVWGTGNTVLVSAGPFSVNAGSLSAGGQGWWTQSVGNIYVPAGALNIGFYCNSNLVFSSESTGASAVCSMGTGGPGNWSGTSSGVGAVGAYITYTPGGIAHVNTGTSASPVWTAGVVYVNTGTPSSPVWTQASGVAVNTGTSGSPVWTQGT